MCSSLAACCVLFVLDAARCGSMLSRNGAHHTIVLLQARLNTTVGWMLPLRALRPRQPCGQEDLDRCLSGFAIQVQHGSTNGCMGCMGAHMGTWMCLLTHMGFCGILILLRRGRGKPDRMACGLGTVAWTGLTHT